MPQTSDKIRIGTRASRLALIQVEEASQLLKNYFPSLAIETVPITTSGDKILDRNLAEVGGKGLFIKELEEALVQEKIDIAVHSAKDLTPLLNPKTEISAFTKRFDARDCLVSKKFNSLKDLPKNAIVGTSSARRKAILLRIRPDLKIINFRGNVDTRLSKVDREEVDASILALCGLARLKKKNIIKEIIEVDTMLPAGGQGALALQVRRGDQKTFDLTRKINHLETETCIKVERAFLFELGASCVTPVAAHAWREGGLLKLSTMILDYDGKEVFTTNSQIEFNSKAVDELGVKAAQKTKKEAFALLVKICKN